MTIHVDDKSMNLVQVTNNSTGAQLGLYFVPYNVTMDEVQHELEKSEDGVSSITPPSPHCWAAKKRLPPRSPS